MNHDLVKLFKALGEGSRLRIVECLLHIDLCACEFSTITHRDQTTASRHLKILVEAGILKSERQGRNIIFSIASEDMRTLLLGFGIEPVECCQEGCIYDAE